jgi:hypothetical protein
MKYGISIFHHAVSYTLSHLKFNDCRLVFSRGVTFNAHMFYRIGHDFEIGTSSPPWYTANDLQ